MLTSRILLLPQGETLNTRGQVRVTMLSPMQIQNCLPRPLRLQLRLTRKDTRQTIDIGEYFVEPGATLPLPFAHNTPDALEVQVRC